MQMNRFKENIRPLIFIAIGCILLLGLFQHMVAVNPVFDLVASEKKSASWERFLVDRQRRNERKMKMSYRELMESGRELAAAENYEEAIHRFYQAKTIFPDKIAPRKNLCYGYLMLCQVDWRYCDMGRRELYYAMKYVRPEDKISYEYLSALVDLVDMQQIIEMDEGAALTAIF